MDDRLPTVKDHAGKNRLIFARNDKQPHEFWVPLLEKAFVKYVSLTRYRYTGWPKLFYLISRPYVSNGRAIDMVVVRRS